MRALRLKMASSYRSGTSLPNRTNNAADRSRNVKVNPNPRRVVDNSNLEEEDERETPSNRRRAARQVDNDYPSSRYGDTGATKGPLSSSQGRDHREPLDRNITDLPSHSRGGSTRSSATQETQVRRANRDVDDDVKQTTAIKNPARSAAVRRENEVIPDIGSMLSGFLDIRGANYQSMAEYVHKNEALLDQSLTATWVDKVRRLYAEGTQESRSQAIRYTQLAQFADWKIEKSRGKFYELVLNREDTMSEFRESVVKRYAAIVHGEPTSSNASRQTDAKSQMGPLKNETPRKTTQPTSRAAVLVSAKNRGRIDEEDEVIAVQQTVSRLSVSGYGDNTGPKSSSKSLSGRNNNSSGQYNTDPLASREQIDEEGVDNYESPGDMWNNRIRPQKDRHHFSRSSQDQGDDSTSHEYEDPRLGSFALNEDDGLRKEKSAFASQPAAKANSKTSTIPVTNARLASPKANTYSQNSPAAGTQPKPPARHTKSYGSPHELDRFSTTRPVDADAEPESVSAPATISSNVSDQGASYMPTKRSGYGYPQADVDDRHVPRTSPLDRPGVAAQREAKITQNPSRTGFTSPSSISSNEIRRRGTDRTRE